MTFNRVSLRTHQRDLVLGRPFENPSQPALELVGSRQEGVLHLVVDIAALIAATRTEFLAQEDILDTGSLEFCFQLFPVKLGIVPAVGSRPNVRHRAYRI